MSDKDNMKMKCLLLANETAAAEVRKHTRTKLKHTKDNTNTNLPQIRPSIASEGVMRELQTKTEGPVPESSDKAPSNEVYSLTYSPAIAAKKEPEEPKIGVQETNQVIPALLALWVPKGAQINEDKPSKTSTKYNYTPAEHPWRKTTEQYFTGEGPTAYTGAKDQNIEEEPVDLFPRRPPRPY